jgi:hypothetical protein
MGFENVALTKWNPKNENETHASSIGLNIIKTKACKLHGL